MKEFIKDNNMKLCSVTKFESELLAFFGDKKRVSMDGRKAMGYKWSFEQVEDIYKKAVGNNNYQFDSIDYDDTEGEENKEEQVVDPTDIMQDFIDEPEGILPPPEE